MMYVAFFLILFLNISGIFAQNDNHGVENSSRNLKETNKSLTTLPHNHTSYIDTAENMIRLPQFNNSEDHKGKQHIKKTKRTVQKIIKKNKSRPKKFYVYHMTHRPTVKPKKVITDTEELTVQKDSPTTQSHLKKRLKKWNSKYPRNPMPFKKLQYKKEKRNKREVRDDVYILKDFDEMKFLSKSKDEDYDVVNAHVKKYW